MDTVWIELIKALPWGFVLVVMRYLEIRDAKEQRTERANDAKDKSEKERTHEMEKNKLWSETIKYSIDKQSESSLLITTAMKEMTKNLEDKYDSMGITKDLLDAARREISKQRKGE